MATTKKASELNKITSAGSHDYILTANDSTGHANLISPSELINPVILNSTDHVRIAYDRLNPGNASDHYAALCRLSEWPTMESNRKGDVYGVALLLPGRTLVINKNDLSQKVRCVPSGSSLQNVHPIPEFRDAVLDMDGYTNTNTIFNANSSFTDSDWSFRAVRAVSNTWVKAGEWYVPSLGEMLAVFGNITLVNYAMTLIGGTQLQVSEGYGTSTLYSVAGMWTISMSHGTVAAIGPAARYVRPMTIFQKNP